MRDFLSETECQGLINLFEEDCYRSRLRSAKPEEGFRTSFSCDFKPGYGLVKSVENKITRITGIDPFFGETMQGQRYHVGERFKPHYDYFHVSAPYWLEEEKKGGQRTWTAMIFLNEPEAGGETNFPNAELMIKPRRGNLLLWNNLDFLGQANEGSLHEGVAVASGSKYIVTKWYRERKWGSPKDHVMPPPET